MADPKAMQRLQSVLDRFEITIAEANDLVVLQDYQVAIIADDSGSMKLSSEPPHERHLGKPSRSRWDELQETIAAIIEISACFHPEGVTVNFLNRAAVANVKHAADPRLQQAFARPPDGGTPLTQTMRRTAEGMGSEGGVLLFVFTDGEPSDGRQSFRKALSNLVQESNTRVQIMALTADDSVMDWLSSVDCAFHEVDVTDDYYSERREVLQAGLAPRFTRGDWCMKAMLGPVSQKYDQWDEVMHPMQQCSCSLM